MLKNTPKDKLPFVEVTWFDAQRLDGWQHPREIPHVAKCFSRGWIVHEDKDEVVLTANRAEDGDYCMTIAIPRGMIRSVRKLK